MTTTLLKPDKKLNMINQKPDKWWAGLSSDRRIFFRDLIGLLHGVRADELLELSFNGPNYSPVLISQHKRPAQAKTEPEISDQSPADWWAGLSPDKKSFIGHLAQIVEQLNH